MDVFRGDRDRLSFQVRGLKTDFLEKLFHDGVQPAGADVFGILIDFTGDPGDFLDSIISEFESHLFRFQQLGVLDDERVFGFGEDPHKIFLGKGLQLDAERETSLHFRNHVRGFGKMKCTGGNEEDVLGPDWAVFGVDRGTFDNRKQVPLDSFPGNIGSMGLTPTGGNLIHLVEEDDTVLLHDVDGLADDPLGRVFARFLAEVGPKVEMDGIDPAKVMGADPASIHNAEEQRPAEFRVMEVWVRVPNPDGTTVVSGYATAKVDS